MKRFVQTMLKYSIYPLSSSLFIVTFLVVFLPFDINRSGATAILYGLIIIGATHGLLLYAYRYFISNLNYSRSTQREFVLLIPFLILSSIISFGIHLSFGLSSFNISKAWEWFYGSMLILPIPHLIMVFSIRRSIFFRCDRTFEGITLDSIFYLRALGNYVELVYSEDATTKKKIIRATMSSVENSLGFRFIRCHRSYIFNPLQQHELTGGSRNHKVLLNINGQKTEIPVSQDKYGQLVDHKN